MNFPIRRVSECGAIPSHFGVIIISSSCPFWVVIKSQTLTSFGILVEGGNFCLWQFLNWNDWKGPGCAGWLGLVASRGWGFKTNSSCIRIAKVREEGDLMFELIGVRNEGGWIPSFNTIPKWMVNPFVFTISKAVSEVFPTSFDSGIYTLKPTYLPWYLKGQNKRLTARKKASNPILKTSQESLVHHTPNTTNPNPQHAQPHPPQKRGLRVFQLTILTWHSVKKVKYSSPSFCTLNRPHLSDVKNRHPCWFRSDDSMGENDLNEMKTQMHNKNRLWKKKAWLFEWTTATSPFLSFFLMVCFHRSFLKLLRSDGLAVVVWLAPAWWKKPGTKTYEPTQRKQMYY